MLRIWIALFIATCLLAGSPVQAKGKGNVAGIPLPPRARLHDDGTYRVAQSYRKTVVYFERYLKRRGILHKRVPTYEVGGVQVTRFLSAVAKSPWLAIHVYRIRGTTHLFVVPRKKEAEKSSPEA